MWLGSVPLLTKGPFALTFGGQAILPILSLESSPVGTYVFCIGSCIFQVLILVIKKARERGSNYMENLQNNLVENVTNVYSILISLSLWLSAGFFILDHFLTVEKNRHEAQHDDLSPLRNPSIDVLFLILAFITFLPFCTRPALRSANRNKVSNQGDLRDS